MSNRALLILLLQFALLFPAHAAAQRRGKKDVAPPPTVSAQDWMTPAEQSDYRKTPRYDETMAYLRRIADAAPRQVKIETFGKTGEGRDLWIAIVSKDGVFDPAAIHQANRPIMLIQNAIHAGEMDGKDASLALLRDMVITRRQVALLERAVVVIIPIYNADGHERFGPYNRINQNGPEAMGWRTTALNLNLNRDYVKADTPETRSFLRLWNRWLPDFYVDDHVTDGADYQFDTTYHIASGPDVDPGLAEWIKHSLEPYIQKSVTSAGHIIGPYFQLMDETDPSKGMALGQDIPRFSTGYTILQNRPGLLVEMHMMKDYKTRVTGNYEILRAMLEVINRDADKLVRMNRDADAATIAAGRSYNPVAKFPLQLVANGEIEPYLFHGYKFERSLSEVSGATRVRYTKEPLDITIPMQNALVASVAIASPVAYIVPAQWTPVIEVLTAHGLNIQRTTGEWNAEVEVYRCPAPKWREAAFEGRHLASFNASGPATDNPMAAAGKRDGCVAVKEKMSYPAGSAVVPLDQRAAKVAIHFLEPEAPDSAVTWGFFDAIFEQKEYGEAYVLEDLAREMMSKDPALKAEFEARVAKDKAFAANPYARLNFFFQRSPYWDQRIGLYPVGRLTTLEGVPLK